MTERFARLLPVPLLALVLFISVATNVVLLARTPRVQTVLLNLRRPAPITAADHVLGAATAPVTVIEYADFQCPFCARFHASMMKLVSEGHVRWVYRHYPLTTIHPEAVRAAHGSECAGDQGRFWEYAARLYTTSSELSADTYRELAREAGIDTKVFESCMASGRHERAIATALNDGVRLKISGTPAYFVNGRRFEGFRSDADLRSQLGVD